MRVLLFFFVFLSCQAWADSYVDKAFLAKVSMQKPPVDSVVKMKDVDPVTIPQKDDKLLIAGKCKYTQKQCTEKFNAKTCKSAIVFEEALKECARVYGPKIIQECITAASKAKFEPKDGFQFVPQASQQPSIFGMGSCGGAE